MILKKQTTVFIRTAFRKIFCFWPSYSRKLHKKYFLTKYFPTPYACICSHSTTKFTMNMNIWIYLLIFLLVVMKYRAAANDYFISNYCQLIIWSKKNKFHNNFPEPIMTITNNMFSLTNSLEPKIIEFTFT